MRVARLGRRLVPGTAGDWWWLLRERLGRSRRDVGILLLIAGVAFLVRLLPVVRHGGLFGIIGYDDGVYFGAAVALVHGVLPYRDILLLHPPGIVLSLTPFALLGSVTGDATAFAIARVAFMFLGGVSAAAAAVIAGRYGRLAGIMAGALYAVWTVAVAGERNTDLHAPENILLLLGLLLATRPGRIRPGRAAAIGAALGLGVSVHLWQGASAAVLLAWVVLRARPGASRRFQAAASFAAGSALAFGLACLPFLLSAPEALVRYTLLDQLERPNTGIGIVERLRSLEGLASKRSIPSALWPLITDPVVIVIAVSLLAVVLVVAWRCAWSRMWVALALVQVAIVLSTPSFFGDYPNFAGPALSLVLGTAVALAIGHLAPMRRARSAVAVTVVTCLVASLAAISIASDSSRSLKLGELRDEVAGAECVSADTPSLLVLSGGLREDIDHGCRIVLDPTGVRYDTDRGHLLPGPASGSTRAAVGYQRAMAAWYASGSVALFLHPGAGLTAETMAPIVAALPVLRSHGIVTVRRATP